MGVPAQPVETTTCLQLRHASNGAASSRFALALLGLSLSSLATGPINSWSLAFMASSSNIVAKTAAAYTVQAVRKESL